MKLEHYLKAENLTDAKFAELVGVDRSTVTRLRNGTVFPSRATLLAIAEATGGQVTANDFWMAA